jgi:hypothetical protein
MGTRLCAALLCLGVSALHAQGAPAVKPSVLSKFHGEVVKLYDFTPGTLPQKEMEAKSGELDAFWEKVKGDPATFGVALRKELARKDAPKFFLYDGSMLLLSLRPKPATPAAAEPVDKADAQLVIASLARCTLKGIQQDDYLRKVHWLASEGNDTTAAAFHALDEPKFQAVIAQHALMLGQDFSVVYMLLPTDEAFYLAPALERLKTEKDEQACASLLKLIWYAATEAGDAAIQAAAQDAGRSDAVRKAAAKLASQSMIFAMAQPELRAKYAAAVGIGVDATVAELKAARRRRMQDNISDEALADLDKFTLLIRSQAP